MFENDEGWIIFVCYLLYFKFFIVLGYLVDGEMWMGEELIVVNLFE